MAKNLHRQFHLISTVLVIKHKKMGENREINTAGKNFTLPPSVTRGTYHLCFPPDRSASHGEVTIEEEWAKQWRSPMLSIMNSDTAIAQQISQQRKEGQKRNHFRIILLLPANIM